ncbi:tripartite motif-containing protein 16-like [Plectropomus leopardus]|uniref:tripartite motif-containing protein 16-like n=1 Tax=Plectropomus leopardus TaxID=160734 RepID=UPI001C4CD7B8|nr:tripartite motif-containing protein 16-like [Plectropomus leopardus]
MAEQQPGRGADLDQNHFCCSVCLDLLKEPVTIPCGHSYCKSCIDGCWDEEDKKGQYSCPQCRETFNPRPVLRRNNMLAEVVEKLKRSSTQQAPPSAAVACAGPADVTCDFCSGTRPNKATMSCLMCLASYCPEHLEPHYSVPVLKKHQLVLATIPLQEKMCSKHNKLMEVYCQTDKKCICYLCVLDEHKGHRTVSAAAERAKEQKQLTVSQKKAQKRFQEREKDLNELLQALKDFKNCSQPAEESCDKIFEELISSIKKRHILVKQLIKDREQTAVAHAEKLQLQLEEEIAKLKRKVTELEQLSETDDHVHFIQTFQSLAAACESPDLPPGPVLYPKSSMLKTVTDCMSKLRDNIESLLKDTWPRISATVSTIDIVLPPVPKTREEFLRYCRPLTLDENTVSQYFSISEENRRVTSEYYMQHGYGSAYYNHHYYNQYPVIMQVLCKEGLSERCYWEVSWSGLSWCVAVSYKDSSRTNDSEFGNDNKSWSLACSPYGCTFRYNKKSTTVSGSQSNRIGVYLDFKAGTLSFYDISDISDISGAMTLLHKEHTTFTQPLYPGLELKDDGSQSSDEYFAEVVKLW